MDTTYECNLDYRGIKFSFCFSWSKFKIICDFMQSREGTISSAYSADVINLLAPLEKISRYRVSSGRRVRRLEYTSTEENKEG